MLRNCQQRSPGFTMTEILAALAILGVAMVVVAQVAIQALREKPFASDRLAAQQLLVNVQETARATPWEKLDDNWAKEQRLPEPFYSRGWILNVRVKPEEARPFLKRVSLQLHWKSFQNKLVRTEELVGFLASREGVKSGAKK